MNKEQLDALRAARIDAYERWSGARWGEGMREYQTATRAYHRAIFAAALEHPDMTDPADREQFAQWASAEPRTATAHYCNMLAKWEELISADARIVAPAGFTPAAVDAFAPVAAHYGARWDVGRGYIVPRATFAEFCAVLDRVAVSVADARWQAAQKRAQVQP